MRRHFPQATKADFEAMIVAWMKAKDKGPSKERLWKAALWKLLEEMTDEVMEGAGYIRRVDPVTGEVRYRKPG